ncbi:MAG TPA: hypothetical protein VIT23_10820 [Terrimicrobiaceae bacterium]
MAQEFAQPLAFLPVDSAEFSRGRPFVAIVRSLSDMERVLREAAWRPEWLQVEGLLDNAEVWAMAAQGSDDIPLDVLLSAPGEEFSGLYRLADVRAARSVRVTMPTTGGFMKALRLAASLGLPVRLLPESPSAEAVDELAAALDFYLHDPMVEAPIEFFHSALAWMRGAQTDSLWHINEQDPAVFRHHDVAAKRDSGRPEDFVSKHLARLLDDGAECVTCRWQPLCQGYFKWPEASYSCYGVRKLLDTLRAAADEMEQDLAIQVAQQS